LSALVDVFIDKQTVCQLSTWRKYFVSILQLLSVVFCGQCFGCRRMV